MYRSILLLSTSILPLGVFAQDQTKPSDGLILGGPPSNGKILPSLAWDEVDLDAVIAEIPAPPSIDEMIKKQIYSPDEVEQITKLQGARQAAESLHKRSEKQYQDYMSNETLEDKTFRGHELKLKVDAAKSRLDAIDARLKYLETKGHVRLIEREKKIDARTDFPNFGRPEPRRFQGAGVQTPKPEKSELDEATPKYKETVNPKNFLE